MPGGTTHASDFLSHLKFLFFEQGRYAWRISSGCTRQSLAENAVYRFKIVLEPKLTARRLENQWVEARIKCGVLNRMAALGLPRSERVL